MEQLVESEKRVDRKSYFHKAYALGNSRSSLGSAGSFQKSDGEGSFKVIRFDEEEKVIKIEDLTRRETSWGDVWDDLYYDEEALAEFKYEAYEEELARLAEEEDF